MRLKHIANLQLGHKRQSKRPYGSSALSQRAPLPVSLPCNLSAPLSDVLMLLLMMMMTTTTMMTMMTMMTLIMKNA